MSFATRERNALADLLLEVGPDAPTLCEGWTTRELAAHVWTREHDPISLVGMAIEPATAALREKRHERALTRHGYEGLVERLRSRPGFPSPFAIPYIDGAVNAAEYFIHHEDVRRAVDANAGPRDLPTEAEAALWRIAPVVARSFTHGSPVPVILERLGASGLPVDRVRTAGTRNSTGVIVSGRASELLFAMFGRWKNAAIEIRGNEDDVAAFQAFLEQKG